MKGGTEVCRFDAFQLDPVRGTVLGVDGAELHLRPKVLALLRHLLSNPGRLLTREQLLDAVWPSVAVTDDSLTQCVGELRQILGDRATHVLRTVPKRGYILIATVLNDVLPPPDPAPVSLPVPDVVLLRQDPVAVYRFEVPEGDRACISLADALTSDLASELTRLDGLRVRPAPDAGPADGYRVKGELRRTGAAVRITIRLESAALGSALWSDRLELPQHGPGWLPETALPALASQLCRQIERHCLSLARRKPLGDLTARELCLIGRDHHQRGTEADTLQAKEVFALAIAADPDYAPAYAWQAYTVHRAIVHGWGSPGGQAARDESLRLARRAVLLDPDSPLCLARLAFSLVLNQRWEEALAAARSALNSGRPAFASSRLTCCEVLAAAGFPEEAVAVARDAIATDPLCPPVTHCALGRALLLAGAAEDALAPLRWCASRLPDYAPTYDTIVVAAVESGRIEEAQAALREVRRLRPGLVPRQNTGFWFFRRLEDVERFQAAYRQLEEAVPAAIRPSDHDRSSGPQAEIGPTLAALRQEMLVVHPLQGMPDDPAAARAASAITANLMAELVRYEDLCVVAGPDGRTARGFALRGDVLGDGERLQALVRLDDIVTGATVWADRIEWPSGPVASLPIAGLVRLAAMVDLQIGRMTLQRARETPPDRLTARELAAIGKGLYSRGTMADSAQARQSFARAAAVDPGFAAAYALHALSVSRAVRQGWDGESHADLVEQAVRLASRAVELKPDSPIALGALAHSLALHGQWEEATTSARFALRTERVAGETARIFAGDALVAAGHPAEAEEAMRQAIERDPHCSPLVRLILGWAILMAGRPEDALRELRLCVARLPDYALGYRTMVVAAAEAGLVEDACDATRHVARLRPDWLRDDDRIFWFLRQEEDRARCRRAFAMARRIEATARTGGLLAAPSSKA